MGGGRQDRRGSEASRLVIRCSVSALVATLQCIFVDVHCGTAVT
jgi:hypothetical protein